MVGKKIMPFTTRGRLGVHLRDEMVAFTIMVQKSEMGFVCRGEATHFASRTVIGR